MQSRNFGSAAKHWVRLGQGIGQKATKCGAAMIEAREDRKTTSARQKAGGRKGKYEEDTAARMIVTAKGDGRASCAAL